MFARISPRYSFPGLALVFATFTFAAGVCTPLLALRQQEWHFSTGTLAIAFSIYALMLLAAVLGGGSLSDDLGRRPVMLTALLGELVSMLVFLLASEVAWLIVARALQGLSTGLATSAFNAAIPEHALPHLKRRAAVMAASSATAGLGIGAFAGGVAVQFSSDPSSVVFAALAGAFLLAIIFVGFTAETVEKRTDVTASLRPRFGLPAEVRGDFIAGMPVYISTWMVPAFLLGLAPILLRQQFNMGDGIIVGFTAFLGLFAATVSSFVFNSLPARRSTLAGSALTMFGAGAMLLGVVETSALAVWVGAVLGGAGQGAAFGGSLRLITPLIKSHQRGKVFSAIYTVTYLAFGLPTIIGGQIVPLFGLTLTVVFYIAVIIVFALMGIIIHMARLRLEPVINAAPSAGRAASNEAEATAQLPLRAAAGRLIN